MSPDTGTSWRELGKQHHTTRGDAGGRQCTGDSQRHRWLEVSGDRLAVSLQSVTQGLGDTRKEKSAPMRKTKRMGGACGGRRQCESIWRAVGEGVIEGAGFCSSVSWAVDSVLNQQFSAGGL